MDSFTGASGELTTVFLITKQLLNFSGRFRLVYNRFEYYCLCVKCLSAFIAFLVVTGTEIQAQLRYITNTDRTIIITGYTGTNGFLNIPPSIDNLPVTEIWPQAFFANTNIMSVTIPGSVTNFGHDAFNSCIGLTNAIISNGVTGIGTSAFEGCIALDNIVIPGSVASIGIFAFVDCRNLNNAKISNGVTSIEAFAFSGTGLTNLILPATLTNIDPDAFQSCTNLTSITIPSTITNIADYVFSSCQNLRALFFTGNAPAADSTVFDSDTNAVVYYMTLTTGWEQFSADTGLTTVLWNPLIQTDDGNFGVRGNQFGFDITGTTNIPVVVEACTNLVAPVWISLQNASLTNGSFYFSDPTCSNASSRFYRINSP